MARLRFICEGPTERSYVDEELSYHLIQAGWESVVGFTLPNGRNSSGGLVKGGFRSSDGYKKALNEMVREMKKDRGAVYTTFFDFYAFPSDIGCYKAAQKTPGIDAKARIYESQLESDIKTSMDAAGIYCRFVPYIQMHEFETLLFADVKTSAEFMGMESFMTDDEITKLKSGMTEIVRQYKSIEDIDDGRDTAPSKRIIKLLPRYGRAKITLGSGAAQMVGLSVIREKCPHFDEWLKTLENMV